MSSSLKKTYKFAGTTALLLTFFLTLFLSVFLFYIDQFNGKLIILSSLFCFVLSFILIQYRVDRYIFKRIEKIYNDVIFLEAETGPVNSVPISTDLDFLSKELSKYTRLKKMELESFRAREEFRKEFVGNVAHELKTPLTVIKAVTETLNDDPEMPKEDRHRFLARIMEQAERLTDAEVRCAKLEGEVLRVRSEQEERLQKAVADAQVGAQRKYESLIEEKLQELRQAHARSLESHERAR